MSWNSSTMIAREALGVARGRGRRGRRAGRASSSSRSSKSTRRARALGRRVGVGEAAEQLVESASTRRARRVARTRPRTRRERVEVARRRRLLRASAAAARAEGGQPSGAAAVAGSAVGSVSSVARQALERDPGALDRHQAAARRAARRRRRARRSRARRARPSGHARRSAAAPGRVCPRLRSASWRRRPSRASRSGVYAAATSSASARDVPSGVGEEARERGVERLAAQRAGAGLVEDGERRVEPGARRRARAGRARRSRGSSMIHARLGVAARARARRARAKPRAHARAQLARGLVGERDREDLRRAQLVLDDRAHEALDEHRGLAGAGARGRAAAGRRAARSPRPARR